MQIAFLIERNIYYKSFGSVMDEALKKGHKVFCFHDYAQPRGGHQKAYQFPSIANVPLFKNGNVQTVKYNNNQDFLQKIKQHNIKVLVTLHFSQQHTELRENIKKQGVYWVAFQHSFDTVNFAKYAHLPDKYFVYTNKWIDWILDYRIKQNISEATNRIRETIKSTGFVQLDQKSLINKEEVRQEWGIPERKNVVLYLPFPFGSSNDAFWVPFIYGRNISFKSFILFLKNIGKLRLRHIKQLIKKQNDKSAVLALKEFCNNNNAYLLVKSRKKDPVPKYVEKVADKVLYDDNFYPSTMLKCLSVSDLCIHFYSSVVTEAVPMDVPSLCITPSQKDWQSIQGDLWDMLLIKTKKLFNFREASYSLTIPETIKELPKKTFKDFPLTKQAKQQYVKEFIGNNDVNYSSLAVKEIESLVNTGK